MEPTPVTREPLHVIGASVRTLNRLEGDPRTGKIGPLWQRFYQEKIGDKIPGRKEPGTILGVYADYESDATGEYTLIVGQEVSAIPGKLPAGLVARTLPRAKCLEFEARGPMPKALIETWGRIWGYFEKNPSPARAYTFDVEIHRPDGADILIAIR